MPAMNSSASGRGRAATRNRILAAAESLFGRYGYEAATVRMIAQQCGLTNAALYYYFPRKQNILDALVSDFRAAPAKPIAGPADGRMSSELLNDAADAMLDRVSQNPGLFRLVRRRALAGDLEAIAARTTNWSTWRTSLVGQFDERFAGRDAERLAGAFISLLAGVIFLETLEHGEGTAARLRDPAFRQEVHMLIRVAVPLQRFARERAASA